ncbi:hypothetical protein JTE90_007474 [Oedothorax gibbosus]|uniref:Uncharacterized protein n=1 Tax=Oedothorax gibbosus TaxID=931172 RepID=A0AAV6UA73_9ARAC|nr:hypothetical protein JTE90_007474 [Oedothorax gibbosus]
MNHTPRNWRPKNFFTILSSTIDVCVLKRSPPNGNCFALVSITQQVFRGQPLKNVFQNCVSSSVAEL